MAALLYGRHSSCTISLMKATWLKPQFLFVCLIRYQIYMPIKFQVKHSCSAQEGRAGLQASPFQAHPSFLKEAPLGSQLTAPNNAGSSTCQSKQAILKTQEKAGCSKVLPKYILCAVILHEGLERKGPMGSKCSKPSQPALSLRVQ